MSLSAAFGAALSGMNVASRGAQVVSSNIANADTEGYGRRTLQTTTAVGIGSGLGVRITGVQREVDMALIADRRISQADTAYTQTRADALESVEEALGTPDNGGSIAGRIAALEHALGDASGMPRDEAALGNVANAAEALAKAINLAGDEIQAMRQQADSDIAREIETLNDALAQVQDVNSKISNHHNRGNDVNAMMDQRQVLIDRIAEIVPLREIQRDNGAVALYTTNGTLLIDGPAAEFGFTKSGTITASQTYEGGNLSGLTMNGNNISFSGSYISMAGGRLEALFEQRDEIGPEAQNDLDALARNIIERFQSAETDPDGSGAGIFTDQGNSLAAWDPNNPDPGEPGLSNRIVVHGDIMNDVTLIRDGLGGNGSGETGDSTIINAYAAALSNRSDFAVAYGTFAGEAPTAHGLATQSVSSFATRANHAEQNASVAAAQMTALREAELANGVDTDAELQAMLRYEEAYIANAKVMQTLETMMQTLMEL